MARDQSPDTDLHKNENISLQRPPTPTKAGQRTVHLIAGKACKNVVT